MEHWVLLSIAAAGFQTLRFALQKILIGSQLSASGATFARFAFAAPFVALTLALYIATSPAGLPDFRSGFWAYAALGGLAQILATVCVVSLFQRRNFAVGITFKKTEVILTALVGFVVLGDRIGPVAIGAILIGLIGVVILSDMPDSRGGWFNRLWNPAAGLGLASGGLFAISAVGYRAATLAVISDDPLTRALVALAFVSMGQAVAMAAWLAWREPGTLTAVWAARKTGVWIGLTSMAGSLCWFTAFTLESAALVFAVGQVEVIFSIFVSTLFFHETVSTRERYGIALLMISIIGLVAFG